MVLFTPPHLLDSNRWRGMRIGLLGGSFNPPHDGHVHISEVAMKRLYLDCVWWIVSPGNPLKPEEVYLPYENRLSLCREIAKNPRIVVSDLERQTRTVRTVDTLAKLRRTHPHTEFVWLAGADIVQQLPRWYKWKRLPEMVSLAFIARPPVRDMVRHSSVRSSIKNHRFVAGGSKAPLLTRRCFWLLQGPVNKNASSKIRNSNKNKQF